MTAGSISVLHGAPVPSAAIEGHPFSWYRQWLHRRPEAPAIEDGPHTWTYRQLDDAADRIAGQLAGRVRPGDLVAVCLDRSAALVAVAVAVAKLGAVYLPLGPRPGSARLSDLTAELRIPVVIGTAGLSLGDGDQVDLLVPAEGANMTGPVVAEFRNPAPTAVPAPEGAFYAVLTSGSTGKPKAVAVGAASLANLVHWYHDISGLGPGDRISLLMAVPFDPHLGDLWGGLAFGATLAVAPDDVRYATDRLVSWYSDAGVTFSVLPTPMAEPFLNAAVPAGLPLRNLLIGGDRLRGGPRPELNARVHNVYGPAETTINVTAALLAPQEGRCAPPIGTPIPGVTVCVVDEQGRVVERGVTGELLVGGACLALGYLDPELTARRFVTGPQEAGAGPVYRTGDQVRMQADGVLSFVGRLDDQVKISGVRIEPAEVEAALESDPAVVRAVVTVRRGEAEGATLLAFVLPQEGQHLDVEALLDSARVSLPEQAVPGMIQIVERFPLNENGKVDRVALLAGVTAAPIQELADDTSTRLAVLWKEMLDANEVHAGSNFFDLGGNSMKAFALLRAIEEQFGVTLTMRTVMSRRFLRDLAAAIDAERAISAVTAEPGEAVNAW